MLNNNNNNNNNKHRTRPFCWDLFPLQIFQNICVCVGSNLCKSFQSAWWLLGLKLKSTGKLFFCDISKKAPSSLLLVVALRENPSETCEARALNSKNPHGLCLRKNLHRECFDNTRAGRGLIPQISRTDLKKKLHHHRKKSRKNRDTKKRGVQQK